MLKAGLRVCAPHSAPHCSCPLRVRRRLYPTFHGGASSRFTQDRCTTSLFQKLEGERGGEVAAGVAGRGPAGREGHVLREGMCSFREGRAGSEGPGMRNGTGWEGRRTE